MIDEIIRSKGFNKDQVEKLKKLNLDFNTFVKLLENINQDNFESEIKYYSGNSNNTKTINKINLKSIDEIISDKAENIIFEIKSFFERELCEKFMVEKYDYQIPEEDLKKGNAENNIINAHYDCSVEVIDKDIIFIELRKMLKENKWVNLPPDVFDWVKIKGMNNLLTNIICNFYYDKKNRKIKVMALLENKKFINQMIIFEYNKLSKKSSFAETFINKMLSKGR